MAGEPLAVEFPQPVLDPGGGLAGVSVGRIVYSEVQGSDPKAGADAKSAADLPVRYPGPASAKLASFGAATE